MKLFIKPANKLIAFVLTLCAFFGITARVNSQTIQLSVDPTQNWIGYVTAVEFGSAPGVDIFGSSYGTAALQAYFSGTNLFLLPCTNVWETSDTTYVQANGETPNAMIDANMYVQNDTLANTNLTFSGACLTNTLTTHPEPLSGSNYTSVAFIKTFNSGYGLIQEATSNLIGGKAFSISLNTAGAAHVQYGFETFGPDANPGTAPSLGDVIIAALNKTVPVPTNNAPTPTNSPSAVLAMYDSGGEYSTVSVDWLASWSDAGETSYTITNSSNQVLEYTALQYAGAVNFNINVSAYNEMHLDVWTPNANELGIELVSLDDGTQPSQVNFGTNTIVPGKWISLNIPLSEFEATNATLDVTALQQLLFIDNMPAGITGGTFYVDNIYFYSNSALVPPPPVRVPTNTAATPTAPSALALFDSSGVYSMAPVQDYDASWSSAAFNYFAITNMSAFVLEYLNLQFAGVEMPDDEDDQVDASSYNTMHVDVWTPNANQFAIQLVSLDDTNTQAGQVSFLPSSGVIVSNQWVGLNIPLSEFTAPQNVDTADLNAFDNTLDLTNLQQLLWVDNLADGGVTGGIFYIDNVYFYNSSVAQRPPLTFSITSGTVNISFPTEMGFNYTVWYTTDLVNSPWQPLSNGSLSGNNYTQTVTDTHGKTNRFYRVSVSAPTD